MIYEEVSSPTGSDDNKCKESLDQPYLIADRCLDFTALIKTKIDDNLKQVLSIAMGEAFDQGYERGRGSIEKEKALTAQEIKKACDKGYKDGKKDGIQEGIDMCTAAIQFLVDNAYDDNDNVYSDAFNLDKDIVCPFDYVLETWSMDYIVDKVNEYIEQHKIKPVKAKDISKTYDAGYADGLKEGEKLGIEECDNAIIYMYKNFKTGDYINTFGYTRLDYVLEEYSMSDIINTVAHYIKINETQEAQFNKLVTDIASKFNVPVETAKNIIKEYACKDNEIKSTE